MTATYRTALQTANDASRTYSSASLAHLAGKMDDAEYSIAQIRHSESVVALKAAYTRENH